MKYRPKLHKASGTTNENSVYANKYLDGGKTYTYDGNSEYNMSSIDFIDKYIPVSNPSKTVNNDFLSGSYYCNEVTPLATNTTASLKILDNKFLEFQSSYVSGVNGMYAYKLEPLGKNAYKLYLYMINAKADSNNGRGVTISNDPLKRTFLIYRTGQESFDLVFISDKIARTSLRMQRE